MNLISPKHSKVDINPWIELAEKFHHGYIEDPDTKRKLQDYIVQEACSEVFLTSTKGSMCLFKWVVRHAYVISLEHFPLFSCFCYFAFGEVSSGNAEKMKLEVHKRPNVTFTYWIRYSFADSSCSYVRSTNFSESATIISGRSRMVRLQFQYLSCAKILALRRTRRLPWHVGICHSIWDPDSPAQVSAW